MTAQEARVMTGVPEISEGLEKVFILIEQAAKVGKRSIQLRHEQFDDYDMERLRELGFHAYRLIGSTHISW